MNLRSDFFQKIYIPFFVIFYLIWAIAELIIRPALNTIVPDGSVLSCLLFDGILKNLCWTLPAWILMTKFDQNLYIHKKELLTQKADLKEVIPVFLGVAGFCILNSVIAHRGFYFQLEDLPECTAFLFVGITEEFVFRGFLLNATLTDQNQPYAVAINAILFLSIHFPIWILYGNFMLYFQNFGFVMILLLSVFFSWCMLYFKNIWVSVGVHMLWDILVTLLN